MNDPLPSGGMDFMGNQANMNLNPFDDTVNISNPFDAVDSGGQQPGGAPFDMFGDSSQQNAGGFDFTNPAVPQQQNTNAS